MDAEIILRKYLPSGAFGLVYGHSAMVAERAVEIGRRVRGVDLAFIAEAALLHDIGIVHTNSPAFGCAGVLPYICHGWKGREMLEAEGLPRHGLVCERHVGTGLTVSDIEKNRFPLPLRDMTPQCAEEEIIAYADKFFTKRGGKNSALSFDEARANIARYGAEKLRVFDEWRERFGG